MVSTGSSDSHYFDSAPSTASNRRHVELVLPDVYLDLTTDSGVFAAGAVDKGTRYLLRDHPPIASLPKPPANIVDLGCGYGPIALAAALRSPDSHVWGIDVNERALGLARENAATNSVNNATFMTSAELPADLRFDLLLSNPPIRIGKQALRALLLAWLPRLTPEGRAWMVVQKHLGSDSLAAWLTDEGFPTTRLGSRGGFRILETLPRAAQLEEPS